MNGVSGFTSRTRLTGLSGFDTESMVTQLMKAERIPLDSLKQKRTLVEWKRDAYRDVTNSLKGFKTKFFDIVNRSSYLLSENSIRPMSAKTGSNTYVTATANADAKAGTQTIHVEQIATADTSVSSGRVSNDITGTIAADRNLANKSIYVTLDGVTKKIALKDYSTFTDADMATDLSNSLKAAFGASKLNVTVSSGQLTINTISGSGVTKVTVYEPSDGTGGLTGLGLTSGESNRISLKSKLSDLSGSLAVPMTFSAEKVSFKINGKTITANSDDTLAEVFEKINNTTEANARISYDEITDKITLTSKQTGEGDNLKLETVTGNFFAALKIDTTAPTSEGHDAKVYINGSADPLVRSSNTFTVNGINYSLNKEHTAASDVETITVTQETDSVITNIKSFIEEYNKLIENLNGKTTEAYDRDFLPLTDEQKEAMEEKDIEKWEERAKTGLLRNDSILQNITTTMRKALYEKVEGVGISLKDIGIESKSYLDQGKLYLDENKLKDMLLSKPDEVTKLLNGVSSDNPTYSRDFTSSQKQDRYDKSGVLQRLADIIEDNISTKRNAKDKKGILLEKAGIENDLSNTRNLMNEELDDFDDRIDYMIDKLTKKEENYYQKFSKLETMLSQMNQQSSWIASQFSSGQ